MKRQTNVKPEIKKQFEDKVTEILEKAKQFVNGTEISRPVLAFRRMGKPAGSCLFDLATRTSSISINSDYFTKDFDYVLNQTAPHEVVHHIVSTINPSAPAHGVEWKRMMTNLGLKPSRCHGMNADDVQVKHRAKPFKYSCGCKDMEHWVTQLRHERFQTGQYKMFRCRICGQSLHYEGWMQGAKFLPRPVVLLKRKRAVRTEVEDTPRIPTKFAPTPDSGFRVVTRFIGGALVNVRLPIVQTPAAVAA